LHAHRSTRGVPMSALSHEAEQATVRTPAPANANSPGNRAWRAFFRNRLAIIGSVALLLILTAVVVGPMVVPRDLALRPAPRNMLQPPSSQHILGTDEVGRDVAARLLYAGRVS